MLIRLLLWILVLFGIYKLLKPARRRKEVGGSGSGAPRGSKSVEEARKDFLEREGEYVDYEEVD